MNAHFRTRMIPLEPAATPATAPAPAQPEPIGQKVDGGFFISDAQLERIWPGDQKKARKQLRMMLADEREPKAFYGPAAFPEGVRIATEEDEQPCLDLLMIDLMENAARVAPIDRGSVLEQIQVGTRKKGGFVGVIDAPPEPGRIPMPVAIVVLVPQKWSFSKAWFVLEVFNFVHPAHRRSDYADKLLQFTKWVSDAWTEKFGYRVYVVDSVLATRKTKEKMRLYRRHMTQAGGYFIYPTPPAGPED